MKKINLLYILGLLFIGTGFQSCSDILESSPKDTLTDPSVWGNKDAVNAYLGKLYDQMQTEDFGYMVFDDGGFPSEITDEAVRSYTWGRINNPIIPDDDFGWWGYGALREVNSFIQKIKTAPVSDAEKNRYEAESRFIRAYHFFAMVKRYGGIPIITEPQDFTGDNMEELQVPRNTEKEVYEFIKSEIDEIVSILPEEWDSANKFRATKYSAYALKSRAMLYAGSIATYGKVQYDGLVGINKADREYFFTECKKASDAIINSGKFELYNKKEDKEQNFQALFLDKDLHSEAIFTKAFSAPDRGHSWDYYNAPQSFKVDYGCVINPTLQLVEEFDYIDGSEGSLKTTDANGDPIKFDSPYDLFKDKDPRLLASIMVPFSPWQNDIMEARRGIINGDKIITSSNLTEHYGEGDKKITITGKDGILESTDVTKTGFYVKKYMDPVNRVNYSRSEVNWMVFRYAEVLLNYAEAAAELNKDTDKGLTYINQVRERAGVAPLTTLSIEKVRKERKVELAFENHRWWDIRRWRVADNILNNYQARALYPYLVWEDGKYPSEMKYIFKKDKAPKETRTFNPKLYYVKIPAGQITTNPKLLQNPGY